MIDIHTHILPNMDDGSDSVETSNKLLAILERQNVKSVCLTSHFYPSNESIEEFIKRRTKSYKLLNYKGKLNLRLGAEIHYYRGISNSEDIGKLCIEGTNILLVELPFHHEINRNVIDDIVRLNLKYDVVLAHIERYDLRKEDLDYLKDNGVMFQVNSDSLESKTIIKLIKEGYIDFIGSDSHDLVNRSPHMDEAFNVIEKKLGKDVLKNFEKLNEYLLGGIKRK